ncbi:hypothetical protein [Bacillus sp. FJAT-50079]|uniref:hypothetical protein n=1 Tax=Bacillus sp. FJAT-50079 TaxID=2833577 RepID=UPI001BC9AE58|nr:hypothetical protein [Bacillus sp. FJAT-50079]MBS4207240.1 hypothetical protein [Bacillus sp. FJAT-50079]
MILTEDTLLNGVKGGDSWGISSKRETPQERSDEEARVLPPGKRPPGTEINGVYFLHCMYVIYFSLYSILI